jgi:hypothetical protein
LTGNGNTHRLIVAVNYEFQGAYIGSIESVVTHQNFCRARVHFGRRLFVDGEVRLVENLPDLEHVAVVGGAGVRP